MIRMIIVASMAWLFPQESYGQGPKRIIHGVVTDAQSNERIPYVYIESATQSTVTDHLGTFSILVGEKDVIKFSHVGYHQISKSITSEIPDSLNVVLFPENRILKEVVITEFKDLEMFKKEVLEIEIAPTIDEVNAEKNIDNSKIMYRMGYRPSLSSYDNYRSFMKGPQPVTFFSSDPSKGIIRAIKNINRKTPNLLFRPKRTNTDKELQWPNPYLLKPDTITSN